MDGVTLILSDHYHSPVRMSDRISGKLTRRDVLKSTGALGAAGMVATAGCTGGGGSGVTIGMADSQTGSLSTFGQRNERGRKIALEDVNEVGVNGGDLTIKVEDTQSDESAGVSAAQKLVNQNGVPLLIGAVSSGVSLAIYKSVIKGSDVVQVSQNSTSPDLSNYPGLLRMSPTGKAQAGALAQMIKKDGYDKVAVTYLNNAYGSGVANAFKSAFDGDLKMFAHDQGKSSYSNVVTSMNDYGADAWLFISYQPEFATMAQEAYDKGYSSSKQFYGSDSVKGPKVLKQAPEDSLEGMRLIAPSAALDQDNYKSFASTFKDKFDTEPTAWSAYTYDAIVTSSIAIEAADEVSGEAIGKVIRDVTKPEGKKVYSYKAASEMIADGSSATDINYEGVSGPIDLDKKGDPVAYEQIFVVKNGEYKSQGFISGE